MTAAALRDGRAVQVILESLRAAIATLRSEEEQPDSANLSVLCQVNTASQKAIQKMERKANKRRTAKQGNKDSREADFDFVRAAGWAALQARSPPCLPPCAVVAFARCLQCFLPL